MESFGEFLLDTMRGVVGARMVDDEEVNVNTCNGKFEHYDGKENLYGNDS